MVRFSCFSGHILSSKPKKTLQPSFEAYHKTLQDSSRGRISEGSPNKTSTLLLNSQGDTEVGNVTKHVSSADSSLKSEDVKNKFIMESETFRGKGQLKKSQSLGSGLYQEGRISVDDDIENGIDQGYSCDGSNDLSGTGIKDGKTDGEASPTYRDQNAPMFETLHESSEIVNVGTVFSIEEGQSHSEKEHQDNSNTLVSDERAAAGFSDQSLRTPRGIVKSCSLPNLGAPISTPVSGCYANLGPRSRSFEDFHVLRWKDVSVREMEKGLVQGRVEDANTSKAEKAAFENFGDDNYDSCHYSCLAKDWMMPVVEKVDKGKSVLEEPSVHQWVELPNKDFKIKRIEEWVKDLQHCSPLDETDEPVDFNDDTKGNSTVLGGLASAKMEDKMSPGMESAKRYISSLSPAATTAQLANHGLVVIPFLSAFVSLRVLNLSGNAIVKITSGALPRGLHTLNLSKNGISTIEGLRELTRLRILDLSYNRILRIGHGLASCSSLKELYLAGNKISEVEGLHRLLKLTVLDLRFNKISTAKCLGQLAANYNSLQAISLEGNPAQKNVGDDQLKKHLQGLLPQLAYFNRQAVKAGALKDSAERSVRLGAGSHQFDRGGRADHKSARKGSHVSAHGRGGQAAVSAKPSKGRHGRLPPTAGTRPTAPHRNRHADFGSRILNLRQEPSTMRRSRSEGTLGAL